MTCNPTRLELSNTDATTVNVTVTQDPGDGTAVVLQAPGLSIDESQDTSGGAVSYSIAARTEATNSLWDATIQVGTNAPADISIRIVETSAAQNVGLTVSDTGVSYCAPTASTTEDSYTILIETPADKDYPIDGRVATARTITNFYAKTAGGTCTATLKNLTDATTIGSINVTQTGASAASLTNTAVDENDRLGITISLTSAADMLEMVAEYTT
jgi:hypothetical protein